MSGLLLTAGSFAEWGVRQYLIGQAATSVANGISENAERIANEGIHGLRRIYDGMGWLLDRVWTYIMPIALGAVLATHSSSRVVRHIGVALCSIGTCILVARTACEFFKDCQRMNESAHEGTQKLKMIIQLPQGSYFANSYRAEIIAKLILNIREDKSVDPYRSGLSEEDASQLCVNLRQICESKNNIGWWLSLDLFFGLHAFQKKPDHCYVQKLDKEKAIEKFVLDHSDDFESVKSSGFHKSNLVKGE